MLSTVLKKEIVISEHLIINIFEERSALHTFACIIFYLLNTAIFWGKITLKK